MWLAKFLTVDCQAGCQKIKTETDKSRKKYLQSKSKQSKESWKRLNITLNESYKADKAQALNDQLKSLRRAEKQENHLQSRQKQQKM